MSNPVIQTINLNGATGNATGFITCQTNAGFTQRAVVTITDATGNTIASGTFQGNGEGGTPTPLTTGAYTLDYTGVLPFTLNVAFSYNPNGTFYPNDPSKVIESIPYNHKIIEHISIISEDSVDNDYNDIIMDCITYATPA
jgi:hypothetical protein